jgi:hypothetical protein
MRSLRPMWFVSAIIGLNLGWAQLPATAKDAAAPATPPAATKAPAAAPNVYPPELLKQFSETNGNCNANSGVTPAQCKCAISEIQSQYTADEFIALMSQKQAQPSTLSPMPQPTGNSMADALATKAWIEQNGLASSDGTPTSGAMERMMSSSMPAPIVAIMQSCQEKFAK